MDKKVFLLVAVIAVVVIAIYFLFPLGNGEKDFTLQEESPLYIKFGEERKSLEFNEILAHDEFEIETDGGDIFKGVKLKDLLSSLDIPFEEMESILTKSIDAYTVALSPEEVLSEDNVYLVYIQDGEALYPKEDGGSGPYRILIKEDPFRQRWNKNIEEIEIR